jgi:hypothetical protein
VVVILRKAADEKPMKYIFVPADSAQPPIIATMPVVTAGQDAVIKGVWPPPNTDDKFLSKLATKSSKLGDLWLGMFQGPVTGKDEVFILSDTKAKSNNLEDALLVPLLKGSAHIRRYWAESTNTFLLFPYMKKGQDEYELISEQLMADEYPSVWRYLSRQRGILEAREGGRFKNTHWYGYSRPQNLARVRAPKLLCPAMAQKACFFYDESGMWATVGSGGGGGGAYAIILKLEYPASIFFVLGIINSSIATHYLKRFGTTFRGGYFGCDQHTLRSFPIRQIDFNNHTEKKMHDTLVLLVGRMLELNKKLAPIRDTPFSESEELKKEIEKTDKEIDNLVYDLYGFTEAERKIVEGV